MISITTFRKMMNVIIVCKLSHWKKQNHLLIKYNSVRPRLSNLANWIFRDYSGDTQSFEVTCIHPLKYDTLMHYSLPIKKKKKNLPPNQFNVIHWTISPEHLYCNLGEVGSWVLHFPQKAEQIYSHKASVLQRKKA